MKDSAEERVSWIGKDGVIFRDTIRSFASGMQIENSDMLRVGDGIEIPQADADGFVIDIALHTVKVQNRDKTIIAIPTWRLMSESFKNWRGMDEVGGCRITFCAKACGC